MRVEMNIRSTCSKVLKMCAVDKKSGENNKNSEKNKPKRLLKKYKSQYKTDVNFFYSNPTAILIQTEIGYFYIHIFT